MAEKNGSDFSAGWVAGRRHWLRGLLVLGGAAAAGPRLSRAELPAPKPSSPLRLASLGAPEPRPYPSQPIHLIVPASAGGPNDVIARPLADQLGQLLGQRVIVEFRAGGSGAIGSATVARAMPDGYTLMLGNVDTAAINAGRRPINDPMRDFTPIALVASAPLAIVANPAWAIDTVGELLERARQRPGELDVASAGFGSPGHLTAALFARAAGVEFTHVPYRGSARALTDLIGGQVALMFDPIQTMMPYLQAGRLRALAVSGPARSPLLPDVPTLAELGFADINGYAWWAVFAPAGLPRSISEQLEAEIERIVRSAAFTQRLARFGVQAVSEPPASVADFQRAEIARWARAVRAAGVGLQ